MENKFEVIMSQRSDADLLKILNEQRNDYQPEAVIAAEIEFKKRNLNEQQIQTATIELETDKKIVSDKANEKLGGGWKTMAFIFPGLLLIIFSGTFKADGYDRKAKELVKWTLFGFGFYFGLALLITILNLIL